MADSTPISAAIPMMLRGVLSGRAHIFCCSYLLLVLPVMCGCQSMRERTTAISQQTKDLLTWNDQKEPDPALQPAKMVAIWSESIIYGPDSRPTRGLGGRVYFYTADHQAVPATGELIVYAYDDEEGEEKPEPDRKYVITAEEFEEHFSPSEFGPSYSVWVPWDAVGGEQKSISLLPIFKTEAGQLITGDYARNVLSGKRKLVRRGSPPRGLQSEQSYGPSSSVQRASFFTGAEANLERGVVESVSEIEEPRLAIQHLSRSPYAAATSAA